MQVTNNSHLPVYLKIVGPEGQADFVHIMARGRVTLPTGFSVDPEWLASNPKVKVAP